MVVLAHGRPLRPEDIPVEVRGISRSANVLPVLASRPFQGENSATHPAELDFILRTIFDLKLDVEDLRREMENFRFRQRRELEVAPPAAFARIPAPAATAAEQPEPRGEEPGDLVVFRPGMTMQDLEREAIAAALRQVGGNRRRAAEMLGIGERTLYRKIKEYELES
jgi:DNA-binding NtrC family response regulator